MDHKGNMTLDIYSESDGGAVVIPADADITLNKVDNNQMPLNGAKFKLCKYETSWEEVEGYENIDMTESATARLADLPIGWYRLTETSAPAGYIIRDNQVYFKIIRCFFYNM